MTYSGDNWVNDHCVQKNLYCLSQMEKYLSLIEFSTLRAIKIIAYSLFRSLSYDSFSVTAWLTVKTVNHIALLLKGIGKLHIIWEFKEEKEQKGEKET